MDFKRFSQFCFLITILVEAGSSKIPPSERIVGGSDTSIKAIPYQAALEYNSDSHCGAVIISENFGLTVARCVDDRFVTSNLTLRTGSTVEKEGGVVTLIKNVVLHPKYDIVNVDYDVAVLEFDSPIPFNETSQPISISNEGPKVGDLVQISGWGTTGETSGRVESLQSIMVPVLDQTTCLYNYQGINAVTDRMFCAGSPKKDACRGDDGGPVTLNKTLVGLVSWGYGCAELKYPGVYTKINHPEIREFIKTQTNI